MKARLVIATLIGLTSTCRPDSYSLPDKSNPAYHWVVEMIRMVGFKDYYGHAARRHRDRIVPLLIKIVDNDNERPLPLSAIQALQSMQALADRVPLDFLIKASADDRQAVTAFALRALGGRHDAVVMQCLSRYLDTSYDYSVAIALRSFRTQESADLLMRILRKPSCDPTARECIVSLAELGAIDAVPLIKAFREKTKDDNLQMLCEETIGKIEMLSSANRELLLLHEVKKMVSEDSSEKYFFFWPLHQIEALQLKSILPDLRRILDQRKLQLVQDRRREGNRKPFEIDQEEWCFQLALTIHKLGGALKPDEAKILRGEGLMD